MIFLTAEEELDEIQFRLAQIVDYYPTLKWSDLKNLHLLSMAEGDCMLAVPHRTEILSKTTHFDRLELSIQNINPKLVILGSAADLFAGNEIDRTQVRKVYFVVAWFGNPARLRGVAAISPECRRANNRHR